MSRRGFTLVEVLLVVAIIGLLAALVTVSVSGVRLRAEDTRTKSGAQSIMTALEIFKIDKGRYPIYVETNNPSVRLLDGAFVSNENATIGGVRIGSLANRALGGGAITERLAPNYLSEANLAVWNNRMAKYLSTATGESYVMGFEMLSPSGASVTSGRGIYELTSYALGGTAARRRLARQDTLPSVALSLNNVQLRDDTSPSPSANPIGSFTLSLFARLDRMPNSGEFIPVFSNTTDVGVSQSGYSFGFVGVGAEVRAEFRYHRAGHPVTALSFNVDLRPELGQLRWYAISAISGSPATLYFHDNQDVFRIVNSQTNFESISYPGLAPNPRIRIGAANFHGTVDDIRLYNLRLDRPQIESLYLIPFRRTAFNIDHETFAQPEGALLFQMRLDGADSANRIFPATTTGSGTEPIFQLPPSGWSWVDGGGNGLGLFDLCLTLDRCSNRAYILFDSK